MPQLAIDEFDTHCPLHACVPELHVKPQLTPLQVAVELNGGVHAVQDVPHEFVDVFDRHWLPQRWKPVLQTKSHAPE
ncbi:MAG TPA: hypothetical protein VGD87_06935, partial [Archangium sp.]